MNPTYMISVDGQIDSIADSETTKSICAEALRRGGTAAALPDGDYYVTMQCAAGHKHIYSMMLLTTDSDERREV